jgi:molybdopterin-guanine dinucleotide biosynthesis protein A
MIFVMEATLLVLAGGEARRMGRSKAWLEAGESTLLRWVVDRLAGEFSDVLVSFAEPEQIEQHIPYRVVFDRRAGRGPLGGIEAGLQAARTEVSFAVACDMPYVSADVARMAVAAARRCDAAVPRIGERPEPVCAAYQKSALRKISAALDAGHLKAADVLEMLDVIWLDGLDPDQFESLNTPEDYRRFRGAFVHRDN